MAILVKKTYIGWIGKNPRIYPGYDFCDFRSKIDNLDLKLKNLKFLGIQPKYTAVLYLLLYKTVYITVICFSIYSNKWYNNGRWL